jgi:hypothetical protein
MISRCTIACVIMLAAAATCDAETLQETISTILSSTTEVNAINLGATGGLYRFTSIVQPSPCIATIQSDADTLSNITIDFDKLIIASMTESEQVISSNGKESKILYISIPGMLGAVITNTSGPSVISPTRLVALEYSTAQFAFNRELESDVKAIKSLEYTLPRYCGKSVSK